MKLRPGVIGCVSLLLVLLSYSSSALAQETATLSGRITDPAGLAIVGAKIEVTNISTDAISRTETNAAGLYNVPALLPGTYRITVEKEGFEQVVRSGVDLHVADAVVLNFDLTVGSVTQSVTVASAAPLVDTTTSSLGGLVNEEKMSDLPLNGRNFVDLSLLQPGVARAITIASNGADYISTSYSSNGAPIRSNVFLMDGALMQNFHGFSAASAASTELGVDGIREYKVVTTDFGAEYGLMMGSQVIISSKGGSNRFHGDAFDYLRNAVLDARNYFDISYLTTGRRVPEFQRNNYGGSFGGPIKKDKTFFYLVYEGLNQNEAIPQADLLVPGIGCRGPAGTTITNAGCPALGAVPSVVISSATAPTLALFPLPNVPGTNEFFYNFLQPTRVNFGQGRVDQVISQSDSLFARYTTEVATEPGTNGYYFPQFKDNAATWDQFSTISESHVFSPTLLNTAGLSFSRTVVTEETTTTINSSGVYAVPPATQMSENGIVIPADNQFQSGASEMGTSDNPPLKFIQNIFNFRDDLFYTRGKHTLKMGALIQHIQAALNQSKLDQGRIIWSNLADFLEGNALTLETLTPGSNLNRNYWWWTDGFYFNDDWHVAKRFTLNLGLRYEFNTTINESNGRYYSLRHPYVGFDGFGQQDSTTTQSALYRNPSLKDFSPRLGFAWDVMGDGKTAVRGGFGVYYDTPLVGTLMQEAGLVPPEASNTIITGPNGGTFPMTFPFTLPAGAEGSPSFQWVDYYAKNPYSLQWNLTAERQLPSQTNLSVSYVGTRAGHLWDAEDGNPCLPTSYSPQVLPAIGLYSKAPVWSTPCGLGRANSAFGILSVFANHADSWYNGLQTQLTKHLTHGLELQNSYTYSKSLDNGETMKYGEENGGGTTYAPLLNIDYGPSNFDVTHNERFNTLYHLPTVNSDRPWAKLVNGWWTSNIVAFQTGYPFNPRDTGSQSNSDVYPGTLSDRPDYALSYDPRTVITGKVNEWYNPNMFVLQPAGYLGNVGRNILRGPNLFNWDLAINKDTKLGFLGESGILQFRAEMFNILNHPNFGLPNVTGGEATDAAANNAGAIVQTASGTNPREFQFALKLLF